MPRTKPIKTGATEKQVTEQVLEAARMLGIELKRRNVGGMTNASGRYVAFGEPGDSDFYATLPGGIHLDLEIKAESFDPRKLTGAKREHFERQLGRLRKMNESGAIGMWVRDSGDFLEAMRHVLGGCRVEIDDEGFCWVTDEPK